MNKFTISEANLNEVQLHEEIKKTSKNLDVENTVSGQWFFFILCVTRKIYKNNTINDHCWLYLTYQECHSDVFRHFQHWIQWAKFFSVFFFFFPFLITTGISGWTLQISKARVMLILSRKKLTKQKLIPSRHLLISNSKINESYKTISPLVFKHYFI